MKAVFHEHVKEETKLYREARRERVAHVELLVQRVAVLSASSTPLEPPENSLETREQQVDGERDDALECEDGHWRLERERNCVAICSCQLQRDDGIFAGGGQYDSIGPPQCS